jgi:hypothetical protein
MEATTKKRRWRQFGIRDVLWVMVVTAFFVGYLWNAHRAEQAEQRQRELEAKLRLFEVFDLYTDETALSVRRRIDLLKSENALEGDVSVEELLEGTGVSPTNLFRWSFYGEAAPPLYVLSTNFVLFVDYAEFADSTSAGVVDSRAANPPLLESILERRRAITFRLKK